MKVSFANCHFHSIFSDGDFSPEWLVSKAKDLGHKAVVLTDHDTVRGCYFLKKAARKAGLLSLTGCEFSAKSPYGGAHLAAFDFNTENERMRKLFKRISPMQTERTRLLFEWGLKCGNLRKGVTWKEVTERFPDNDYLCNNQVFALMVERGIYKPEEYAKEFMALNFSQAVDKTSECYEEIQAVKADGVPDLEEVISTVIHAGGVPVIAHPAGMEARAEELVKMGIMGFETHHPDLSADDEEFFDRFCTEHNLYKMGGTDHSGPMGCPSPGYGDMPADCGGTSEEEFMKLYNRELG
ncbi:MAG: PHP domain-containing protein [Ruminococcaceae bacterium]|nr:PHP domain-containing protein [Oscillospiraceae bacterium]